MITETKIKGESCRLCQGTIGNRPHLHGESAFCCRGCLAVYQILESAGELQEGKNHPLYLQAARLGLIAGVQEEKKEEPIESEKLYLLIEGMWCPPCAELITLSFLQNEGVKRATVDYTTDLAVLEFYPRRISKESLFAEVASLGYKALPLQEERAVDRSLFLRFIVAAFCSLNLMMFAYPLYATFFASESGGLSETFALLSLVTALPVLLYSGYPIWRRAIFHAKQGLLGMELLATVGVWSAFLLSLLHFMQGSYALYFDSMSVIITLLLLGKFLESRAKFSAKESLFRLTLALPKKGRRVGEGFVPLKEVKAGDHLQSLLGEKIVLDGIIIAGEGTVDESMMTGEAIPKRKGVGEPVFAGTLLQSGSITYRVTRTLEKTAIHHMIEIIEQELTQKLPYKRLPDKIIPFFVPAICLLSLLAPTWLDTLAVLLIACPCALGIAHPLVEARLLTRFSQQGAIIRNRAVLQWLGKESTFVFDKTGTLTEGKFTVQQGLEPLTTAQKSLLKGLVLQSNHPISVAIAKAIQGPAAAVSCTERIGRGLVGEGVLLGSQKLLEEEGIVTTLPGSVYFVVHNEVFPLQLGDQVREGAKALVQVVPNPQLISGDGPLAVKAVAAAVGIEKYFFEKSPLEKCEMILRLKERGEVVAFLGDGVNDAPALAAASIGFSMASAQEMAIHVSDIVLTTDDLGVVETLRRAAVRGRKRIFENLFWAFFYNILGVGLALFGYLTPIYAAAAMTLSSLIVLLNSQRS